MTARALSWVLLVFATGALALLGCGRSNEGEAPGGSSGQPVELENVLSRCKPSDSLAPANCPEEKAWLDSKLGQATGNEKALFALLSDPRPLARFLVLRAIDQNACRSEATCAYAKSSELSERLLTAAEAERDARVAPEFARPIARIDVTTTRLVDRAERLIDSAPEKLSQAILATWLERNPALFPSTARFASSPKAHVRRGALEGLDYVLEGSHHAEACALAAQKFGEGPEYDFLAKTIVTGVRDRNCSDAWDPFLTSVEARGQKGIGASPFWFKELFDLWRKPGATAEQVRRIHVFAVATAESTANDGGARVWALGFAVIHHPDPQGWLKRFDNDPDPGMRKYADTLKHQVGTEKRSVSFEPRPQATPTRLPPLPAAPTAHAASEAVEPGRSAETAPSTAPETSELRDEPRSFWQRLPMKVRVRLLLGVLGLCLISILGFVARRRVSGPPVVTQPAVTPPRENPLSQASGSKPPRASCAQHGLATGPDGRCVLCRSATEPPRTSAVSVNWTLVALVGAGLGLVGIVAYFLFHVPSPPSSSASNDASNDAGTEGLVEELRRAKLGAPSQSPRNLAARTAAERAAHLAEYFDDLDSNPPKPSEAGIKRRMSEFVIELVYQTPTRVCETLIAHGLNCTKREGKVQVAYDQPQPEPYLVVDGSVFTGIRAGTSDDEVVEWLRESARHKLVTERLLASLHEGSRRRRSGDVSAETLGRP